MDDNDRKAIEGLFTRLDEVARRAPPRDRDAEEYIGRQIARTPGAPYFMAQTIVVQEAALTAAQARIEELENRTERRSSGGGLFSGVFGEDAPPPRPASDQPGGPRRAQGGPWARPAGGGGFLAGAAQTAMGVAGGLLLGNAIGGMLGGGAAEAADAEAEAPEEDPGLGGAEDFGDMDF